MRRIATKKVKSNEESLIMKRRKRELMGYGWIGITLVGILLFFTTFSYAEMYVIGEGVGFTPENPRPGETVFMDIRFRVEGQGAPVPIAFSVVEPTRTPDWSHPSIPTGTFA